ncbi:MAG: FlgD immunoglobulin-like domain containing protein [Bacteroidota bacterium]|nr:FlgD immunoglobulin-like domain containing protein [Bacteroidota bacterium]
MRKIVTLVAGACAFLSVLPFPGKAQTGWDPDKLEVFGANLTGSNTLNLGWTTGNAGNTWQENEWPAYQMTLKNVNLSNPNFSPIVIEYDFTAGNQNARFVDLVRGVQIGTTPLSNSQGWPQANGSAYPMTTIPELNAAQRSPGVTGTTEWLWSGWAKITLPYTQVNRDQNGGTGNVTDAKHRIIITRQDIINALTSANIPTNLTEFAIYFNLHLSQSFVWQYSLQSQLNTPPTDTWGGYLYGANPYLNDSRPGSGAVGGSSGQINLTYGNKTAPIPVPPAPIGTISGMKWHDINYNGMYDAGEQPINGWEIKVTTYIGNIPVELSQQTSSGGAYSFNGLPGAIYLVSEKSQGVSVPSAALNQSPPSQWGQSYPTSSSSIGIAVGYPTPPGGIAAGYAPYSWQVDLTNTNTQGNLDFGNGVPPPQCTAGPTYLKPCENDNATFTVSRSAQGTPPYTYAWTGPNNFSAATQSIMVQAGAATAGVYSAVITDANGLSSQPCQVTLDYNPLPTVSVNSETICYGQSATLTATTNAANPSYSWSPGGATTASINVNPTTTTVYTVTVTDGVTNCSNTAQGTVTVNPLPVCSITPTGDVCPGATTVYSGPENMASYSWSISGAGTISGPANQRQVTVVASSASCNPGSYQLTLNITDNNNCSNTCSETISIRDVTPPVITVGTIASCYPTNSAALAAAAAVTSVSDNCAPNITPQFGISGTCDVTITVTATDACNNTAVEYLYTRVDGTPPTVTTQASALDRTLQCNDLSGISAALALAPSATDNCTQSPTIHLLSDLTTPDLNCPAAYTRVRKWNFTDDCGNTSTDYTQTITVIDNTPPTFTRPADITIYRDGQCGYDASVSATGDVTNEADNCGVGQATYSDAVDASDACAVVITRTWSLVDNCGNKAADQVQTITVKDNTIPLWTSIPLDKTIDCADQIVFDMPTASDNCGTATVMQDGNDIRIDGSCPQSYTLTRSWKAVDACGNETSTISQMITVQDVTPPTLTVGPTKYILCNEPVQFDDPSYSDLCDPNPTLVVVSTVTVPGPESGQKTHIRTWYAVDACGNKSPELSQSIIEERCEFRTLTQGFYGNSGGTFCGAGHPGTLTLITQLLAQGNLVLGLPARQFTITMNDAPCIITYLPGTGPAAVLPTGSNGFGTNCALPNSIQLTKGKIRNILLTQTITLGLNLRLDPGLGSVFFLPPPTTPYLRTTNAVYVNGVCGDGDDVPGTTFGYFYIPPSVLTAMGSTGTNKTVADLFAFANIALGGGNISPASLGDVNAAVTAINNGFDNARFFSGYFVVPPPKELVTETEPSGFMLYDNHPNPFNPNTTIAFSLPEESDVRIIVRNSLGAVVTVLVNDRKPAGHHFVQWNSLSSNGEVMPSGVYTYEMLAVSSSGKEFQQVKKMILMK